MAPRVTSKTVQRWFVGGKGYATRKAAYISLAKSELKAEAVEFAEKHYNGSADYKYSIYAFYLQKFPLKGPYESHDHYQEDGDNQFWDNEARWKWIRNRAAEMIEEDRVQSVLPG